MIAALCCCAPVLTRAQPTQPRLVGAGIASNHLFGFNLYAPLGRTYEIDTSPDFKSWSSAAVGIVGDIVPFVDGAPASMPRRFYRASINWTIQVANNYLIFLTNSGVDGRVIAYPYTSWNTAQGKDGRLVAWPAGWSTNSGPDGRLIAYPVGWTTTNSPDGRLVAFPPTGCTLVTNPNGRITIHPTSTSAGPGTNSYVAADWKLVMGGDGRQVAYPISSFSTNHGGDGRLVAYATAGWSNVIGQDGRLVAYPAADFITNSSLGGRILAFPKSGWATAQGLDGRRMTYPAFNTETLEIDFEDQQFYAFLGHLRSVLGDPDFENYIIYTFFGTGGQRFPD